MRAAFCFGLEWFGLVWFGFVLFRGHLGVSGSPDPPKLSGRRGEKGSGVGEEDRWFPTGRKFQRGDSMLLPHSSQELC